MFSCLKPHGPDDHYDRKNCVGCVRRVLIMRRFQRSNENWKSVYFNYEKGVVDN